MHQAEAAQLGGGTGLSTGLSGPGRLATQSAPPTRTGRRTQQRRCLLGVCGRIDVSGAVCTGSPSTAHPGLVVRHTAHRVVQWGVCVSCPFPFFISHNFARTIKACVERVGKERALSWRRIERVSCVSGVGVGGICVGEAVADCLFVAHWAVGGESNSGNPFPHSHLPLQ